MNQSFDKRIFIALIAGIVIGSLISPVFTAPAARANLLDDFWNGFLMPFHIKPNQPTASSSVSGLLQHSSQPAYEPAIEYERAVIAAVKKASPAVVSITVSKYVPILEQCPYNPFPDLPPEFRQFFSIDGESSRLYAPCDTGKKELQEVGGGSGFIISPNGLILTNKHVVADAKASYIAFTNDGKKYEAKVLARDPIQDLAVIKIEAGNLPTVELGNSDPLELGQTAIAIGNALGEFRNTVSVGVISGLSRTVTAGGGGTTETIQGVIQTDAAINPGNSGGPLLNLRGQVIGINTALASGAQNIGFAIPINRAKRDIQSVKTSGEIRVPFLGVRYVIVTPELAKKEKLSADYGALVRGDKNKPGIEQNSPAAKADIKDGDIILEIDHQRIDKDHALATVISEKSVGQTISLKINRGGKELDITLVLEKRSE